MIIILGAIIAIALVLWRGYVFSILWAWFVAVKFGLPILTIPEALGLSLFVSVLVKSPDGAKHDPTMDATGNMFASFVFSFSMTLGALGIGWIIKQWI